MPFHGDQLRRLALLVGIVVDVVDPFLPVDFIDVKIVVGHFGAFVPSRDKTPFILPVPAEHSAGQFLESAHRENPFLGIGRVQLHPSLPPFSRLLILLGAKTLHVPVDVDIKLRRFHHGRNRKRRRSRSLDRNSDGRRRGSRL